MGTKNTEATSTNQKVASTGVLLPGDQSQWVIISLSPDRGEGVLTGSEQLRIRFEGDYTLGIPYDSSSTCRLTTRYL